MKTRETKAERKKREMLESKKRDRKPGETNAERRDRKFNEMDLPALKQMAEQFKK